MMPPKTIAFGIVLILIGAAGYFGTGTYSITAWIPAFIGLPLLICGLVGLKEAARKHAMHVAAMVGLLGAVGSLLKLIPTLLKGGGAPAALISQGLTGFLCALFVFLCVRSFIAARKAREAAGG